MRLVLVYNLLFATLACFSTDSDCKAIAKVNSPEGHRQLMAVAQNLPRTSLALLANEAPTATAEGGGGVSVPRSQN